MLLEKLDQDIKEAMKNRDNEKKDALRMIKGEIPRLNLKAGENPTDEQIHKIIKKLIKGEVIVLEYSGQDPSISRFIGILEEYLPQMMDKGQIQSWIVDNIDLSQFNPKIKAMGPIMKHLNGKADGKLVKQILTETEEFIAG